MSFSLHFVSPKKLEVISWGRLKSRSIVGRFSVWRKWLRRERRIYSLRPLHVQTVPNCKAVWCGVCVMLVFDLCVWSFTALCAVSVPSLLLTLILSFFPPPQLYHVIWMNLHRDSPIWRRRGFRKCLKTTQQQQAEFPVYGNSIGTN